MGRDATKAAGNPWYQARKKAAEYDDRLCSRESAAEQLGMSVSSLADAELGNTKFMPVDKAVLMADRYNAPWLLNHYCLNECPIGCRHSLSDEVVGIDRVTVKLLKSLKTEKLGDVKDTLLDIAADGKITEDEKPALQEVLAYLNEQRAKAIPTLKERDKRLERLWAEFGDVPMNPETEEIEAQFLCFPAGTNREEVWEWFDERYSRGVAKLLLVGEPKDREVARALYLQSLCTECDAEYCVFSSDGICKAPFVTGRAPGLNDDGCTDYCRKEVD